MTDPINLNVARAIAQGDCRLALPIDILKDTIRLIENGEINPDMMYIAMREKDDDGWLKFPAKYCGMQFLEVCGLLTVHTNLQCRDDDQ